jgi:DNA-binding NtrC family response regulator
LAEAIHQNGITRHGPFHTISATRLADHEIGDLVPGPTGIASGQHSDGESDAGTVLVDEVGRLPPRVQEKLADFLKSSGIPASASNRPSQRIIATSSDDLAAAAREGAFRDDLWQMLKAREIRIPPLRERRRDIPLLIAFFLRRAGRDSLALDPELRRRLESYHWPANVQELRICLEGMAALARGDMLTTSDLPSGMLSDEARQGRDAIVIPPDTPLEVLERAAVEQSLRRHGGNRTRAAKSLGISVRTLQRKLKAWAAEATSDEPGDPQ